MAELSLNGPAMHVQDGRADDPRGNAGKNQQMQENNPSGGEKSLLFIYVLVIIEKHKITAIFPLQSPSLICNICKNNVAAGAM
jgi:hypothetical protein